MRPAESKAKHLIEALEPDLLLEFVEDQSSSIHDFWALRNGSRSAAIEVTSHHDEALENAYAAIRDERRGGCFINGRLVNNGWYLRPERGAKIGKLRRKADRCLAAIEAEGIEMFDSTTDSAAVASLCEELGVESGQVFLWKQPKLIGLALPGQSTWVSSDHALEVIRDVADKQDNRRKLDRTNLGRRVLFIEVAASSYPAWAAVTRVAPPTLPPSLPAEITDVWLVASIVHDHIVWRWDGERGWRTDVVEQRFDEVGRAV